MNTQPTKFTPGMNMSGQPSEVFILDAICKIAAMLACVMENEFNKDQIIEDLSEIGKSCSDRLDKHR